MANKAETYKVYENNETGSVYISDQVVASIAHIAAAGVEGVAVPCDMSASRKIIEKSMSFFTPKKTKIIIKGQTVYVNIFINILYGYNLLKVSNEVQQKVIESIENMTGMQVIEANVDVAAVEVRS